ncbi:MAG: class I SAM-dependent methyltransferase [Eubacteriales bacterium]
MDMFEYYGYFAEENQADKLIETENRVIDALFDKYLPGKGELLDSSAGVGRNAFRFARLGYTVTAGDFIAEHVDAIRANPEAALLKGTYCANARNLSAFADGSFDVVISLGSMYHMRTKAEREVFFRESLRVLRPSGIFAFTYMSPMALTFGQYFNAMQTREPAERLKAYRKLANVEKTHVCDMFYGMTLDEMTDISREYGVQILSVASTYGMFYTMADDLDSLSPEEYEKFTQCQIATCEDPVVTRYCMRGLFIGRKKELDMFD